MSLVKPNKITVPEALRLANHDFLNRLQMIMMYNELDKKQQCQMYIAKTVQEMQVVSTINRAGAQHLAEWLLTVAWRYKQFTVTLTSTVEATATIAEAAIIAYLDTAIAEIANQVDNYQPHYLTIDYAVTQTTVTVAVQCKGQWQRPIELTEKNERFTVKVEQSSASALVFYLTAKQGVK